MKIGISKEFIKYCLVGIVNTTVGCLTAFIALNILHFNYYVSTTLSYITGVSCSFILNLSVFSPHQPLTAGISIGTETSQSTLTGW